MGTIVIVILVLILLGGLPMWGGSNVNGWHGYGWYPSGGVGLIVIILLVLLLAGRL